MGVPVIRPDGQDRRDPFDAVLREATRLEAQPRTEPAQPAVARGPEADLEDRGGCRVGHPEVLEPGQLDADRPAQDERRRRGQRVDDHQLAAEATAQRGTGHPDCGDRPTEEARQLGTGVEGALRRARDVEDPVAVQLGHRDLRLEVALVDPARRESAFNDDVAGSEGRVDVAPPVAAAGHDVFGDRLVRCELLGPAADRRVLRSLAGGGLLHDTVEPCPWRTRRERPLEVDHGYERGRLDQHERGGVGGGL